MSIRPLLTGWDSQPQEAVGIDLGNPLTHGLVRLIPAPQLPEVVEGNFATTDTTVNALTSTGRSRSYASGTYAEWAINRSQITNAVTIFSLLDIVVSGSPNNFLVGDVQAGGLGYNYGLYSNSTFFSFFLKTGGAGTGVNGTSLSNVDRRGVCLAGTYDGADQRIFVNGVQEGSTAKTGNVDAGAFSLVLNRWNGDSAHTGRHYLTGVWNRALSAQELQSLTANPWQLFAPISIPANTYTPPPAPTGKRYRQIVSGWDTQPQEAVEVDWGNSLTNSLTLCLNMAYGTKELVRPDWNVATLGSNGKFLPRPQGMSLVSSGVLVQGIGLTTRQFAESPFNRWIADGTPFTVIVLVVPFATGVREEIFTDYLTGGSSSSIIIEQTSGNQFGFICNSVAINTGTVVANKASTLCLRRGATHLDAFVDAIKSTPVTLGGATGGQSLTIGASGAYGGLLFRGSIPYFYLWNRALTDVEVSSVTANPWQLFAPLTTNVPIYTPSAGIPLLSSPTLSSITTTSARPQVSITF